eukprot:3072757-Pleurochrysis_carterae.AAC.2
MPTNCGPNLAYSSRAVRNGGRSGGAGRVHCSAPPARGRAVVVASGAALRCVRCVMRDVAVRYDAMMI